MLQGKAILIVEDNIYFAMNLAFAIEDLDGCVIGPVGTVAEALAIIEAQEVAAAVLDSELADRDVTDVVLQLTDKDIPFVVHSGTGLPQALVGTHGDIPVLMKPAPSHEVITYLAAHIESYSPASQSR